MGFLSFFKALFSRTKLPETAKWLFIGLGNPGEKYCATRHNIGFRVVEEFCKSLEKPISFHDYEADCLISGDGSIVVAKPTTFMNRSGDAVLGLMNRFKVPVNSVVVVVDDFNIACGTIRVRRGGSHGGHNGLKSISSQIGDTFPRVRVGIGPLPPDVTVIDFVLGQFSDEEEIALKDVLPRAVSAMNMLLTDSIETVMNKYNK
jgi:PTH1 family peptidyl-tRNA hydrolase